jgi:pSer/pThr/pTyr-binding forkhead associated (FHA) protein
LARVQVNLHYDVGVDEEIDSIPPNAFVVIEGGKIYPLVQAVINIGRALDNHLVIDDPRVSRSHAQLRAIHGHFVLFDLNSTGGILVNGRRITETIIFPHDTISIGGVVLTFNQDNPPPRPDLADTVR